MTLEKTRVELTFTQGIDTKTNPKLLTTKFTEMTNCEIVNGELVKSTGYDVPNNSILDRNEVYNEQVFNDVDGNLMRLSRDVLSQHNPTTTEELKKFLDVGTVCSNDRADYHLGSNIQTPIYQYRTDKLDTSISSQLASASTINPFASPSCVSKYGNIIVTSQHSSKSDMGTSVAGTDISIAPKSPALDTIRVFDIEQNKTLAEFTFSVPEMTTPTNYPNFRPRVQAVLAMKDYLAVIAVVCTDTGTTWDYYGKYDLRVYVYRYTSLTPSKLLISTSLTTTSQNFISGVGYVIGVDKPYYQTFDRLDSIDESNSLAQYQIVPTQYFRSAVATYFQNSIIVMFSCHTSTDESKNAIFLSQITINYNDPSNPDPDNIRFNFLKNRDVIRGAIGNGALTTNVVVNINGTPTNATRYSPNWEMQQDRFAVMGLTPFYRKVNGVVSPKLLIYYATGANGGSSGYGSYTASIYPFTSTGVFSNTSEKNIASNNVANQNKLCVCDAIYEYNDKKDGRYIETIERIHFLKHSYREDLSVINYVDPPVVVTYNLTKNQWELTSEVYNTVTFPYQNPAITYPNTDDTPDVYGGGYLGSPSLIQDWKTKKLYFVMYHFPYLIYNYQERDAVANLTTTPPRERRASIFLMNIQFKNENPNDGTTWNLGGIAAYNLVDKIVEYNAGLNNFIYFRWDSTNRFPNFDLEPKYLNSTPAIFPRVSKEDLNYFNLSNSDFNYYSDPIMYLTENNSQTIGAFPKPIFDLKMSIVKFGQVTSYPCKSISLGKATYINTPQVTMVTGSQVTENNFHDYPQIAVRTFEWNLMPLFIDGIYQYAAVYQWVNSRGEIVRSSPSIIKTSNKFGSSTKGYIQIYVTIPPWFSQKKDQSILLYRTKKNESLLRFLDKFNQNNDKFSNVDSSYPDASKLPVLWNSNYTVMIGSSRYQRLTYIDRNVDSNLDDGDVLYTSGGVLGDFPIPPVATSVSYQNRLWFVPFNNRNIVQYSKLYQTGYAAATHPALYIDIEPHGGDIVELSPLDDKLIIFKQDFIYYVQGDGVDNTGQGSSLSLVTQINSPVGCSEPRSVVRVPLGIIFKSSKGIYLLDRSLQVSYIGADVEKYNDNVIYSVTLLHKSNRVKFTASDGIVLTYDYYYNLWYTEDNLNFVDSATDIYGNFVGITRKGSCWFSNPLSYRRDGEWYSSSVKTGWIKLTGLQDFVRIYSMNFLEDYKGDHEVTITVSYNYDSTIGISNTFTLPNTSVIDSPQQLRVNFTKQKCESIQLTISDTVLSGAGNSYKLSGLTFVVGAKKGVFKIGKSRSFPV